MVLDVSQHPDCLRRLVGIAQLEPSKDVLLDKFLMLPNDCKALMSAQFNFNLV